MNRQEMELLVRCARDPWYFMTECVKTRERTRGATPFPRWDFLRQTVAAFQRERMVVILKSRQMMVSWTTAAFLLWECLCVGDADQIIISKREEEAREMLNRIRFMHSHLPDCLRARTGTDNARMLEFPGLRARIISLPSSPDIGRTYSPSRVFWDEMAFTPDDERVFQSLQPSLDGGGRFIGVSSSNGPYTTHGRLCLEAERYGVTRLDLHYRDHPEKDAAWEAEARKGMSIDQWNREQEMSLDVGGRRVYERFSIDTHVTDWRFQPGLPTYRAIDFGYRTPVVLWFQVTPDDVAVCCREWIGMCNTRSEMIAAIRRIDAELGISEDDVECTFCDPAGAQVHDDGISSVETLGQAGMKLNWRGGAIESGVDLVREQLMDAEGKIRLLVDRRCERVIRDFQYYQKKPGTEEPLKDGESDHTMDALRYFMVNYYQATFCSDARPPRVAGMAW